MISPVTADRPLQPKTVRPPLVVRAGNRRRVWAVLVGWATLWGLLAAQGGAYSWHYFALGARLITESGVSGGWHVYAVHPELQIGPLALVAAIPFSAWGGAVLAQFLLTACGLLLLKALVDVRRRLTGVAVRPLLLLATGLLMLPIWCQVATHFTHLDDALALAFCVAAVAAVATERAYLAALALAASIDSKPWALGFVVLLMVLPRTRRVRAVLLTAAGVAAAWLPFVVADPRTLQLGRFTIDNVDTSALRALGVHAASTPSWDRPAQLLLGVAVAAVCVARGRWTAVPLGVIASRLLLDPETYAYYTSGLLVATAIVDLLRPGRRLPLWTAAATGWFLLDRYGSVVLSPGGLGVLRAGYCLAVLGLLVAAPRSGEPPSPSPGQPAATLTSSHSDSVALPSPRPFRMPQSRAVPRRPAAPAMLQRVAFAVTSRIRHFQEASRSGYHRALPAATPDAPASATCHLGDLRL